jgi:hypothetical protein
VTEAEDVLEDHHASENLNRAVTYASAYPSTIFEASSATGSSFEH